MPLRREGQHDLENLISRCPHQLVYIHVTLKLPAGAGGSNGPYFRNFDR